MERQRRQKSTWVFVFWNLLMIALIVTAMAYAHGHHYCQSLTSQRCNQAVSALATAGIWVMVAI